MANLLRVIARQSDSVSYGVVGYPDILLTVRTKRQTKTGGSAKKILNASSDIVLNADVKVEACGKDTCQSETISARSRVSGSIKNKDKVKALARIREKVEDALPEESYEGFVGADLNVDIAAELAILFPPASK